MLNKISYLIVICLMISSTQIFAESIDKHAGEYGFQMLKICSNPEFSGQGQTGTLYSPFASVFFIQPAAALNNKGNNLEVSTTALYADTQLNSVAWKSSHLNRSIGVGVRYLDYGKIDERLDSGLLVGSYNPIDIQLVFNFAQRIYSNHLIGINLNGLYEDIQTASAAGVSVDLGYIYETPIKNLKILAAVKNMGGTNQMESESIKLPFSYEFGVANYMNILPDINLNYEVKSLYFIEDSNAKLYTGATLDLYNMLYLRAGYKINHDSEGISTGVGVKWHNASINYSFIPSTNDLDDIHSISVGWSY